MKKLLSITGVALALTLTLAGCSNGDDGKNASPKPEKTTSATPTPSPTDDADEKGDTTKGPAVAEGAVITYEAQESEKNEDGEYDKFPVKIDVQVKSVDPVTEDELKSLMDVATDDQKTSFPAFDFYKVNYAESYISGKDPVNQATYTNYKAIDTEGTPVTKLSIIGFDWCKSNAFSKDFIEGTPNKGCIIGGVAKGNQPPAGIQFSQFGTDSEKEPVDIYKH